MNKRTNRQLVGEFVYIQRRGKRGIYQADFHWEGEHIRRSLKTANTRTARSRALELERHMQEGRVNPLETTKKKGTPRMKVSQGITFTRRELRLAVRAVLGEIEARRSPESCG